MFALPNVFLTLLGGICIDKLGYRWGITIFSILITFSQLIITLSSIFNSYTLLLVGRAFFGINSENLIVSQAAIISLWFSGKESALAMGLIMTIPELGSALNSFLSPLFYEN